MKVFKGEFFTVIYLFTIIKSLSLLGKLWSNRVSHWSSHVDISFCPNAMIGEKTSPHPFPIGEKFGEKSRCNGRTVGLCLKSLNLFEICPPKIHVPWWPRNVFDLDPFLTRPIPIESLRRVLSIGIGLVKNGSESKKVWAHHGRCILGCVFIQIQTFQTESYCPFHCMKYQ